MSTTPAESPPGRGRPKDPQREAKARDSLLKAAAKLLKTKSYTDISIRELGAEAKLNSAMISYYFGSKEDLFFQVLKRGIGDEAFQTLGRLGADPTVAPLEKLQTLIRTFVCLHHDHPWISRLIIDQVVLQQGKLRRLFIQNIVRKNEAMIRGLIEELVQCGEFREDLDIEYARTSLISLLAFPFVAAPMLKDAVDFDLYRMDVEPWVRHTFTLFIAGCAAAPQLREDG
ncbi:TetR/AcrR family transcriptional regulator [Exilibacterium tricleocarpae]|uniref:TetR/AcrR family transcriptional regulator n=1 Tax=Exilibacterium tricleocarpae TaxID=2591008 RepID=A0A545UA02_9GAMM|nr:TetR family transcriptional regulator [Exilibacterium tricleocarpae]TQV86259.1 TetR/AcrR family transcriptional regulator [Exilibacterium tricleocarpae]